MLGIILLWKIRNEYYSVLGKKSPTKTLAQTSISPHNTSGIVVNNDPPKNNIIIKFPIKNPNAKIGRKYPIKKFWIIPHIEKIISEKEIPKNNDSDWEVTKVVETWL